MTAEQKKLWEIPGWKLNSLKTAISATAEFWENQRIGLRAIIRRDITGKIIFCKITGFVM